MQQSHLILWNSLTSYGRAAVQMVIGVVLVPYVIHRIGTDSYGVVVLAMSALDIVELVGRGFGKAVVKHVAEQRARGNAGMLGQLYNSSLLWFFGIGLAGSAIAAVVGVEFDTLFGGTDAATAREGRLTMYIIAATICPSVIAEVYRSILAADQKYDLINVFGVARAISRIVLIVGWFNLYEPSLLAVVIVFSISHLVERIGVAVVCLWTMTDLRVELAAVSRNALRLIIGFAGFYLLLTAGNALAFHVLKFLIGYSLHLEEVGRYHVAFTLMGFGSLMVNSFVNVLVPVASKYQGLDDYEPIRKLAVHGTKYGVVMVVMCLAITAPFIPDLLQLYVGRAFVSLTPVLAVMFATQVIYSASVCANQVLTGLGEVRVVGIVTWVWASGGIAATAVYLMAWPHPGPDLLGVVVIMGVARSLAAVYVLVYTMRYLSLGVAGALWRAVGVPSLLSIPVIALGALARDLVAVTSWLHLAAVVGALELLYVLAIARWSFDAEEWARTRHLVRRVRARLGGGDGVGGAGGAGGAGPGGGRD